MELSSHIKQLLYKHDCVIVPSFGGFVCAHKKLEFNIHTGLIHPPRKTVAFNQNLNNNDGLLANHIAQKENIGAAKALENINAWVSNLHLQLQKGETINIKELGSFSLTSDKKVLFIAFANVNFSPDTYGLETVTLSKKVGFTSKKEKVKQEFTPPPPAPTIAVTPPVEIKEEPANNTVEETIAPSIPPKRKKRTSFKAFRRALIVIIGLIIFSALFILQDSAYHYKMDKGSLFDVGSSHSDNNKTEVEPVEEDNSSTEFLDENSDNSIDAANETESAEGTKNDNSLENSTVAQPIVETSITKTAKTDSVFYIIAGAFSSESNANDLSETLNQKGFASEIIKVPGSSLYRVGYQQYPTRKKAEGDLNTVRNTTHNFAAWVLAVKP